jgi:hypothetical protein
MKARASLGLSKLSVPAKIEKGRNIVSAVGSNPVFKNCVPPPAELSALLDELTSAYQHSLSNGSALYTTALHQKEEQVDNAFSRLVNYVEIVANGDESVILSAAMGVKGKSMRKQRSFTATHGEHEGEAVLQTAASKSRSYIWQKRALHAATDESASAWELAGVSTSAKVNVQGLVAGVKYQFRMAYVTGKGQGAWSDPVSLIAH